MCVSKVASMQYVADSPEKKQARKGFKTWKNKYTLLVNILHV